MRRLLAVAAAFLCIAAASDPAERLADPAQEARAREIFREVRCLVCQNESIDDSQAELAQDLRAVVREQVAAGRGQDEIKAYLVARYGEFVLLKPPFNAANLALWVLPFAVVLIGLAAFLGLFRRRAAPEPLSPQEEEEVSALLDADEDRHDCAPARPHSSDDIKIT